MIYSINMQSFIFTIFIISVLVLFFVTSLRPQFSQEAKRSARRYEMIMPYVLTLQTVLIALFFVISVLLSVLVFGWLVGTIVSVVLALEYSAISKTAIVRKYSEKIFVRYEKNFYQLIDKIKPYLKFMKSISASDLIEHKEISSREDLKNVLQTSTVLSPDEKLLFLSGLEFGNKSVADVMTPRAAIKTINKSEFLGPLVLDDLHKYGHSRLPVINKDLNHVVGILYIHDLLTLEQKKSSTAEKIMEQKVYYIHKDQTLEHALSAFVKTKHHLFIVINEMRETVGLLTLDGVMESLIGRKLQDRFSSHDDIRQVASRLSKENNNPPNHQDV